jgi:hypothetical protein
MRNVREWEEGDLDAIVAANEKENVSLDYKASEALNFGDRTAMRDGRPLGEKHREDLIRDVAAMANAEGGLVIYGIKEKSGGYPKKVDDGIDLSVTNADRIEQILNTNIHPRIEGFFIKPVELKSKGTNKYAFVVYIPKATTNAPHQADDKVYYKRHDATKLPMDDHEVRDMVGRSLEFGRKFGIAWDLLVEIRRIIAAATERSGIGAGQNLPRATLSISVSQSLRTSGVAIMALPQELRQKAGRLINDVDRYNSVIETVDPGQREEARLTEPLRALLRDIIGNGEQICGGLLRVLQDEPR